MNRPTDTSRRRNMTVKIIVEMEAKPGQRDELKRLIDKLIKDLGPSLTERGSLGSTLHEVVDDPDLLVEIADWVSVEAREAVMADPATGHALAPVVELLASPLKGRVLQVR
jgi:quinol monooxygenase YgiN